MPPPPPPPPLARVAVTLDELVTRVEVGAVAVISEGADKEFVEVLAHINAIISSARRRINRGSGFSAAADALAELRQPREALDALADALDSELRRGAPGVDRKRRMLPLAMVQMHLAVLVRRFEDIAGGEAV